MKRLPVDGGGILDDSAYYREDTRKKGLTRLGASTTIQRVLCKNYCEFLAGLIHQLAIAHRHRISLGDDSR